MEHEEHESQQYNYRRFAHRFPSKYDQINKQLKKFSDLTNHWEPRSDIWYCKYGNLIAGGFAGLSAVLIGYRFRKFFKLGQQQQAFFNVYMPLLTVPLMMNSLAHLVWTTLPILSKEQKCPICINIKSSSLQTFFSTIYPVIFGGVSSAYFARYFNTYPFPDDLKDKSNRRYILNEIIKGLKKNKVIFGVIGLSNFLVAWYIAQQEQESMIIMTYKLNKSLQENQKKSST